MQAIWDQPSNRMLNPPPPPHTQIRATQEKARELASVHAAAVGALLDKYAALRGEVDAYNSALESAIRGEAARTSAVLEGSSCLQALRYMSALAVVCSPPPNPQRSPVQTTAAALPTAAARLRRPRRRAAARRACPCPRRAGGRAAPSPATWPSCGTS